MSLPLVTAPEIFRKTVRYCSKRAVISLLKNRRISGLTFYLWRVTWSVWCWWMLLQEYIFLFLGINFFKIFFEIVCFSFFDFWKHVLCFLANLCKFFSIFYVLRRYWCIFCWFCPFLGVFHFCLHFLWHYGIVFWQVLSVFGCVPFSVSIFFDIVKLFFGHFCHFLVSIFWGIYCVLFGWFRPFLESVTFFVSASWSSEYFILCFFDSIWEEIQFFGHFLPLLYFSLGLLSILYLTFDPFLYYWGKIGNFLVIFAFFIW